MMSPFAFPQIPPVLNTEVGIPFNIPLSSNPTIGYSWNISRLPQFISLTDEYYIPDPSLPGMVGVGGTQVFTFVAVSAGDDILSFNYSTPWGVYGGSYAIQVIASY